MTDDRQFDEPDLRTHIRNVLEDLCDGALDGVDEAYEAITEHPGFAVLNDVVRIRRLPSRP